ncbi:hypothetical protein R1flu_020706 [Riccia fluitans]|uniref:Uncharacterized protein n=1 Tax=Riccia fluitans TaxID=41844 RepID=A0ABD1ZMG9_9MARC
MQVVGASSSSRCKAADLFGWGKSSISGACVGQSRFGHKLTMPCRKSTAHCLSKTNHSILTRGLFGPELSYELADQLNAWIVPGPPEPVQFPRKNLSMKFAVLLMRSAYEAVDDLDFVPMNKFQQKFWKLRQSELEPYTLQYKPLKVKYGDLTDPLYFDFISFSQFATISQEIRNSEVVFQEKVGANGETRTVRRDASLSDNSKLPTAFIKRAGDLIYQRLVEGFEDQSFNAPSPLPEGSSFDTIVVGVRKVLQILVDQGYALKAVVDQVEPSSDALGGKFRVKVDGGATLWGLQTLKLCLVPSTHPGKARQLQQHWSCFPLL